MAIKLSVEARNAKLDALETYMAGLTGTEKLRIYTGTAPSAITTAATGTLLVDISLPTDFMAAASGGSKALSGTWSAIASATGTAGYFRIVSDNAGTITSSIQGTVSASGGGGDLILNSTSITSGQTVTVTAFTLTEGNA